MVGVKDVKVPRRDLYIDGKWTPAVHGKRIDIITPIDGSVVGSIPSGTKEDVEKAIKAAKNAHQTGTWRKQSGAARAKVLRRIASIYKERTQELAQLETLDNGKPIVEAEADMGEVVGAFEFYAGLAEEQDKKGDEDLNIGDENMQIRVRKEPLGVCALITPWNWKIAPALAAGNTIVLKPSEMASINCLELGEIATKAGLPNGVLNIVTGLGGDAGAPLSSSKLVDKVSFTGSVATGRRIGLAAMQNLKPTTMELGGKSPVIVFADSVQTDEELEKVVEWIMFGIFWTVGEICSATSRLLVEESVADKFYALLKKRTEEIQVGNPLDQNTRLGPLVNESQFQKVLGYIENAKKQGCRLLTGGSKHPKHSKGYYVQPTVFVDVQTDSQLWNEEVFGPVLAARTFKTEEEAVRLSNDSEFGLAAAVFSKDQERCDRIVDAFECGIVWVNLTQLSHISAPWGGVKDSGFGRDCGKESLSHYQNVKQIVNWHTGAKLDWFPSSKL